MCNNNIAVRVSIIMPTYNRAPYIRETIESVCNQTYRGWELIIIDDGSDDNTAEIIMEINDQRIKFSQAGRIGIAGRIKNIALQMASGELIAFIDSDDLWDLSKLEKQLAALDKYPGAGFSITGGFNFKNLHEPIDFFFKQKAGIKYDDVLISFFKSELPSYIQSLIFRKTCLSITGNFNEVKSFSDVDFILKLASHFKAVVLYEPLLFRRLHAGNDSKANRVKRYTDGIEMIELYKKILPANLMRNALFSLYINWGEDDILNKKRKEAMQHFFYAWKIRPYSSIAIRKIIKMISKFK